MIFEHKLIGLLASISLGIVAVLFVAPMIIVKAVSLVFAGVAGMIVWGIQKNVIDPLPDYGKAPLETNNNMFKMDDDDSDEVGQSFRAESYPLSGKTLTDKQLHSLFDMIEKVYVRSWYNRFSANQSVPRKLRHIICFMTKKLSGRVEKMDIQQFIFEDTGEKTH